MTINLKVPFSFMFKDDLKSFKWNRKTPWVSKFDSIYTPNPNNGGNQCCSIPYAGSVREREHDGIIGYIALSR